MIISSYVNKEIIRPLVIVSLVLGLLMVSYSSVSYFADAANRIVDPNIVTRVILAKTLVAFELFLPLALFITLLLGLGKLYSENEIAAINAAGLGSRGLIKILLPLVIVTTLISAWIATMVRPWAYEVRYEALRVAEQTIDFDKVEAGHFYANDEAGSTYFAAQVEDSGKIKRKIFINEMETGSERLIYAEKGFQGDKQSGQLVFLKGSAHRLDLIGEKDWILQFDRLVIYPSDNDPAPKEYKRKAASTPFLLKATSIDEIAELQWRLTNPLKALLLAILAIYLAKTVPRQGRYGKLTLGIVVFFSVHVASVLSRTWIEQGVLPLVPGLWWIPVALLILVMTLVKRMA